MSQRKDSLFGLGSEASKLGHTINSAPATLPPLLFHAPFI